MKYVFHCCGNENIRATHVKTIEFTRERDITPRGDCIIGTGAEFDASELRRLSGKVRITVEVGGLQDTFKARINPNFGDHTEIVFRKSRYDSRRTLGFGLNKGANRLDREIVRIMQNPNSVMKVSIEEMKK